METMVEEHGARRGTASLYAVEDDRPASSVIDIARAERAVADLLAALGRDPHTEHLAETPRRVVAAFAERLTPQPFHATTFPNDDGYDELVLVRDIPFRSLCEHHLLPFHGVAHVGYLPGERIVGLSKLARIVDVVGRDLQVQERMTMQVARWLERELRPRGVGVVLTAEHTCMTSRGALAAGAVTTTSRFTGELADDAALRDRFLHAG